MLGVLGRMCVRWSGVCVCSWSRHGEYLDRIFNSRFEGIATILSWILLRFLGKFDMVSKKHSTRSYCSMYVCVGGQASLVERGIMSFLFLAFFSILVMCTFGMDSGRKWLGAKFVFHHITYLSSVWGCQSVSFGTTFIRKDCTRPWEQGFAVIPQRVPVSCRKDRASVVKKIRARVPNA
jgi:hypothetical protein